MATTGMMSQQERLDLECSCLQERIRLLENDSPYERFMTAALLHFTESQLQERLAALVQSCAGAQAERYRMVIRDCCVA